MSHDQSLDEGLQGASFYCAGFSDKNPASFGKE
jgi:hypothetical protein